MSRLVKLIHESIHFLNIFTAAFGNPLPTAAVYHVLALSSGVMELIMASIPLKESSLISKSFNFLPMPGYHVRQVLHVVIGHEHTQAGWAQGEALILQNLTDFKLADDDFDPICLLGKYREFIKEDIEEAYKKL